MSNTRSDEILIGFVGDIAPARFIRKNFEMAPFDPVNKKVVQFFDECEYVVGNIEAPISNHESNLSTDHMTFSGSPELFKKFKWINTFITANNHINDCGSIGVQDTVAIINEMGLKQNGIFKETYKPLYINDNEVDISIISFTDMLNHEFTHNDFDVLRMDDKTLEFIIEEDRKGQFVIVIAHVGSLFSSFPNPITRRYLHQCVDSGADLIVTIHSHVIGGVEYYKGTPIFHSLGDFFMDGASKRRRTSIGLKIAITQNSVELIDSIYFRCGDDFHINLLSKLSSFFQRVKFSWVSFVLKNVVGKSYDHVYNILYKIEIISHIRSTFSYLILKMGIFNLIKLAYNRREEVSRLLMWTVKNRTKLSRDDDALLKSREHNIHDVEY